MIFISTDILSPYKRNIVSQDHYDTLIEFLQDKYPNGFKRPTDISINGNEIELDDYDTVLKDDDVVVLLDRAALPVGLIGGWFVTALANLAISVTLSFVANKLFSPDSHEAPVSQSSVYNINSAQNAARFGSPVPIVYGKVRMYPSMIVQPYYKFINHIEYLYHVLCVGQGTMTTNNIMIGDDVIENTNDVDWKILNQSSFYNIPSNAFGFHITKTLAVPSTMKINQTESEKYTISADASQVEFDYMLPNGLFYVKGDGEYVNTARSFKFRIYTGIGGIYTEVFSQTITENTMTVDAIQRTFTKDISNYDEEIYVSFEGIYFYDHPRDTHDTYIKRVKEIHPNEDFTQLYGDITLLAVKIKATDTVSASGQLKVNGYFERTDVGNTMSEVLTDIYTNTKYGAGLSADDLNFPTTIATVNCAYDSNITIFDAMRRPAIAQGYSVYLAGMDVILKKDAPNNITSGMYNEMNILRNTFKSQYLFKEEFQQYDGYECTYIDGNGWIPRTSKYPATSIRPKVVDLFGVVKYDPTGGNLSELSSYTSVNLDLAHDIAIKDNVAYVVSNTADSVTTIDISNPLNMTELDSITSSDLNGVYSIAINNNIAYAVTSLGKMVSIDISNPSNIVELSTISSANLSGAYNIEIKDNIAYVVARSVDKIVSVDISSGAGGMVELDAYTSANMDGASGIAISGNVAYVTSQVSDSITSIDISTPSSMSELDSYTSANLNGAYSVDIVGNTAYVASNLSDSITAIDISNPSSMSELGSYTSANLNGAQDIIAGHDIALVVSYNADRITTIDVSNASSMSEISSVTSTNMDGAFRLEVYGNVAYVVSNTSDSITAIDIT